MKPAEPSSDKKEGSIINLKGEPKRKKSENFTSSFSLFFLINRIWLTRKETKNNFFAIQNEFSISSKKIRRWNFESGDKSFDLWQKASEILQKRENGTHVLFLHFGGQPHLFAMDFKKEDLRKLKNRLNENHQHFGWPDLENGKFIEKNEQLIVSNLWKRQSEGSWDAFEISKWGNKAILVARYPAFHKASLRFGK